MTPPILMAASSPYGQRQHLLVSLSALVPQDGVAQALYDRLRDLGYPV